jgi:hypothetical protein
MKQNNVKKRSAFNISVQASLVMILIFCIAMIPAVTAESKFSSNESADKFIANQTVTMHSISSKFKAGTPQNFEVNRPLFFAEYNNHTFFRILEAAGDKYTSIPNSKYDNKNDLKTITIDGKTYPDSVKSKDYKWVLVSSLDQYAHIYSKGLSSFIPSSGTYYFWYGNNTAARGKNNWLVPTVENATYIVKLDVTFK